MITRIVRMVFRPEAEAAFLAIWAESAPHIRAMPGCVGVELYRDHDHPHTFYTLSNWEGNGHLNAYRASALFGQVWPRTKMLFAERPQAHTLVQAESDTAAGGTGVSSPGQGGV